ncbi:MAG: hypothetical protein V3T08_09470 [Gemmatimonadota bacterium]
MIRTSAVRSLIEEHGPQGFLITMATMLGLTEDGRIPEGPNGRPLLEQRVKLSNGSEMARVRPEQFSIKGLWEAMVGPVEETLGYGMSQAGYVEHPMGRLWEAEGLGGLASTAFPSAVGMLIATRVIEGYEAPGFVGDELVTTMPSRLRGERVVGFTTLQGPKVVGEGDEYEDSTFGEKFVTTTETKRGRLIKINEETIWFDQTGQILQRAQNIGRKGREDRERRILRGVADVDSGTPVYRPSGTAEQLYSAGNNNLLSTATPLVDWTDIQEAMAFHATTVTDDREPDDELGAQPIVWMPTHVLTAVELTGVSARIFAATLATSGGVEAPSAAILNALGAGTIRPVSSPFLDAAEGADQYDDASDWFIGDFARQFIYKEIWPLQVFRAPAQNPDQFYRDVIAAFKIREYGDVNATDERLVIKVNAV